MTKTQGLTTVTYQTDRGEVVLSPAYIRGWLVSGSYEVTDQEVMMFLNLCKYQQLNPFLREAYLVKYSQSEKAQMVVSKDVFIKRAVQSPEFDGMQSGVVLKTEKGLEEREGSMVLQDEKLVGGWAIGNRKDWSVPKKITVALSEYIGLGKDGKPIFLWKTKPATMIVKVAESQLLRAIVPDKMQGLFGAEEMNVDEAVLSQDAVVVESPMEVITQIEQMLEDNPQLLPVYVTTVRADVDDSKGVDQLKVILEDLQAEIKKATKKEKKAPPTEEEAKAIREKLAEATPEFVDDIPKAKKVVNGKTDKEEMLAKIDGLKQGVKPEAPAEEKQLDIF